MYDLVVVGGGHSGVEAANVASKMGLRVALVLFSEKDISSLPCNVGIGGSARGTILKEMNILAGLMPLAADENQLQTKVINSSKGPAVRALRIQVDKLSYPKYVREKIKKTSIEIIEDEVIELIITKKKVSGVLTKKFGKIKSKYVIIATGTFLNSKIIIGDSKESKGPDNKKNSTELSKQLKSLGFNIKKLKTGTSPRIFTSTIDFDKLKIEAGSNKPLYFTDKSLVKKNFENQPAWITYTNEDTHKIIKENFSKSILYVSEEELNGPKYCPSIEDKVKRFSEKERHQIFLEIESKNDDTTYLAGLSTSLPLEVQKKIVNSIDGLKNAKIKKPGYAIQYDSINPNQLHRTLETKIIENLYFAGQVNCTSGYVEAASQGLIAGINVWTKSQGMGDFVISRNEGYIGVLIDDLTTKAVTDPYIILTSRSEYRLILREDNATRRLYKKAYDYKLISKKEFEKLDLKYQKYDSYIDKLKKILLPINDENLSSYLRKKLVKFNLNKKIKYSVYDLIKIPNVNLVDLLSFFPKKLKVDEFNLDDYLSIDVDIKFKKLIMKQNNQIERYLKYHNLEIPRSIDYDSIANLSSEAKSKLKEFKPSTIDQATKIAGINQGDIIYLIKDINKNVNSRK